MFGMRRFFLGALAGLLLAVPAVAQLKDKAEAFDFTAQVFITATGEFSPDIFKLEKFASWNFHASWEEDGKEKGGKFEGILFRVALRADTEVFAQGRQGQLIIRELKTKKILRTWNLSDIYIGTDKIGYRAMFMQGLDCYQMEVTLISGKTKISRELHMPCGE